MLLSDSIRKVIVNEAKTSLDTPPAEINKDWVSDQKCYK
ncbi:hypothetical protein PMAG_a4044 [Pseudoalteromonas mariniglutinosa NCIMB 1770]|nr:hypothetical protein [Pseudoalteromonas mariniglutinosa NCIMB 1770]